MKWVAEVTVNYLIGEEKLTASANSSASLATWFKWVIEDREEATSFLITLVPLRHEKVT